MSGAPHATDLASGLFLFFLCHVNKNGPENDLMIDMLTSYQSYCSLTLSDNQTMEKKNMKHQVKGSIFSNMVALSLSLNEAREIKTTP